MADENRPGRMPVDEARARIVAAVEPVDAHERVPIIQSVGRVLVEDVAATGDVPPFDYSAMDGYAVRAADVRAATDRGVVRLRVVGRVGAGEVANRPCGPGEAWRIVTGAPIPPEADAVIPYEMVRAVSRDGRVLEGHPRGFGGWDGSETEVEAAIDVTISVVAGDDVRSRGEDHRAGSVAMRAGTRVRPVEVAVLASLGREWVWVTRRLRVGVLSTGDELAGRDHAGPLPPGAIRDANGPGLMAMVTRDGAMPVDLGQAPDDPEAIRAAFLRGVEDGCDAIVSSGGVSMGDRDMVRHVVGGEGEVSIWRVDLRPGKPFAFGRFRGVPLFGLPGNPVSALVTYDLLVAPALRRLQGETLTNPVEVPAVAAVRLANDSGREQFMRGIVRAVQAPDGAITWHASPTGSQGSGLLSSLARANCLIRVPATVTEVPAGGALRVTLTGVAPLW